MNCCMNAERKENRKKMRILMGESMGGAMALRLHRKKPDYWDGAILVAPMCKVGCVCVINLTIFVQKSYSVYRLQVSDTSYMHIDDADSCEYYIAR